MVNTRSAVCTIFLVACFSLSALTQGGPTGGGINWNSTTLERGEFTFRLLEVRTEKLESKLMGREMPFRVVLPKGYDDAANSTKRYPVIYLLHGLTGNYANWTDRTDIYDATRGAKAIIVTPEGENGWYTDSATKPEDRHESYIVKELIPEVDKRFRTKAERNSRAIAGLSMGGYGALKFGLKYPEMFSLAGSFSGALGAATFPTLGRSEPALNSLAVAFGPMESESRKTNDIFSIVRESTPDAIAAFPYIYFDCGTEDFLIANNREFMALLSEKKVPHEYRQLPGGHTWPYWGKQVKEFLQIAESRFAIPEKVTSVK